MSIQITYLRGDATVPQAAGQKIIAHICNDLGGWGKGFVLAISVRWAAPEEEYRLWHRRRSHSLATGDFALGQVQFVQVDPHIYIANMIAQRGITAGSSGPPIRYDALEQCLKRVADRAAEIGASVHMPRIGCGLAGGKWDKVEPIIERTLCQSGVPVTVYDYTPA
jgi:O-acetyl-ADP-ribose deacetylase (regulator of RNase III)